MMNCKGFGRKRSWPNFKVLSRYSPGGTEESHKKLNPDSRSPGPGFESWTSRMRNRSVNHLITMFGRTLFGTHSSYSTSHEGPHYVIFPILLLLLSRVQIFTSAVRSPSQSVFSPCVKRLNFTPIAIYNKYTRNKEAGRLCR
jgi:hypothetical protein